MELASRRKITGTLKAILDEAEVMDYPLTINSSEIASFVRAPVPSQPVIISAFHSLGYKAVPSYIEQNEFRVNCSIPVVYNLFKAWKLQAVGEENMLKNVKPGTASHRFLTRPLDPDFKPDFSKITPEAKRLHERESLFFPNPEKDWGPKTRAPIAQKSAPKPSKPDSL